MLKGLALTPPVIGRISIGKVVEKNGKRLPEKDDEFTLTSQVQSRDGWINHPLDEQLRKDKSAKLRSIPVRLLFDDPDLSLRAHYTVFDRDTGRPLCVGDGGTCKRSTISGMQSYPCPAPPSCPLAEGGRCKPYGRLHVRIEVDEVGSDELGSFVLRTTGFNSIRTLATRQQYLQALSGDRLASLPLELRLRGKSTTQSHRSAIYYVDLVVRQGLTLTQALEEARKLQQARQDAGFDQKALDEAARQGYAQGAFEESEEEGLGVVEEFYPEGAEPEHTPAEQQDRPPPRRSLSDRLGDRLEARARQSAPATA